MATNAIRSRCVRPETMQLPEIKSQCMRLAYLIQAFGLATTYGQHISEPPRSRPKPSAGRSPDRIGLVG
jgi:hypothetical protein